MFPASGRDQPHIEDREIGAVHAMTFYPRKIDFGGLTGHLYWRIEIRADGSKKESWGVEIDEAGFNKLGGWPMSDIIRPGESNDEDHPVPE